MPTQFDLIVFDWDGTLFDSTALITRCIQAACRDLGVAVPTERDAAYVIGLSLIDALRHAAPALPAERYPELARRYQHHYFNDQHEITLFAGVPELLDELKQRGHWLAIATGKSRRGLDEALAHSAIGHLFDSTRTADETASKPNPQMLLELMRELGTEPDRTLMIGDTSHDLQLAANAAVPSVAVAYGAHEGEHLADFSPRQLVHSVDELAQWLRAHA